MPTIIVAKPKKGNSKLWVVKYKDPFSNKLRTELLELDPKDPIKDASRRHIMGVVVRSTKVQGSKTHIGVCAGDWIKDKDVILARYTWDRKWILFGEAVGDKPKHVDAQVGPERTRREDLTRVIQEVFGKEPATISSIPPNCEFVVVL